MIEKDVRAQLNEGISTGGGAAVISLISYM